ncbi:cytochrome d ubiquinol oxidase subunit II [Flavihumibacter stibioxidans]|uniref:Cytochrome d ubiquinol oxidase subunit II n=1 Tax=Flavihumibacter stibioxidans TaxID=1834163 RepID=A0ABR7M9I6_9BACT|nr:cytochrome d ubiquinol oxidase subunit II [Flavihumibacter stibioxidans]MBC6491489.1 cytochrome d ubiquinol oxidase subunit II [Flavihumibacter stibioxidans]
MFLGIDYNTLWFLVFGAVITGYAILDGFDLGAGALHLFLKKEKSRRIALNAIGPVWDGNEVWLVIAGGALFAGFPVAYAAVFSAFYLPAMIFLIGLIWRAVAIEFRSKEPGPKWRLTWDIVYTFACVVVTLSLGLMLGNVALGLPLNEQKEFAGGMGTFFNPFSIMVAVTTLALFMTHGAIYLAMKTEDRLYTRLTILAKNFNIFFLVVFALTTLYTLLYIPHLSDKIRSNPAYFIFPAIMLLAIANIPRQLKKGNYGFAFISSSVTIAALLVAVAVEVFPNLLYASNNPANSITIDNAASSQKTMGTLLLIAAIGTPLVGIYTSFVFWTFKGKVKLDETSY